jgi:hypothetical protein
MIASASINLMRIPVHADRDSGVMATDVPI